VHTLCAETLTASVGDDEGMASRVGEVIAVEGSTRVDSRPEAHEKDA
jgi:hypothetical protein